MYSSYIVTRVFYWDKEMNKEQIESLIEKVKMSHVQALLTREWFEQNPIKPAIVGLSDSQMTDISNYLWKNMSIFTPQHCNNLLIHWAKTQAFAQPQQFQPNWDDAPDESVIARIWVEYVNKHNVSLVHREILAQYEHPKPPAPCVVFNVDYIYKNAKYSVVSTGKMKVGNDWIDCVNYTNDDHSKDYTRTLEDFLAKFERVGGE